MNKQSIRAHAKELQKIINSQVDGCFSSKSSCVDGRTLRRLTNRKVISLIGYDKKQKVNVYKITKHQINDIRKILEVL